MAVSALVLPVAGCGESPTSPSPPPPPPLPTDCQAINYIGSTGGERIQAAIHDQRCSTVYISPQGPDLSGAWLVREPVFLRSHLTLTGTADAERPVLQGQGSQRVLMLEGVSNVTIRSLDIRGDASTQAGVLVRGSDRVTFDMGSVSGMSSFGIFIRDVPSSNILITSSTFQDNGLIDVRTSPLAGGYHANVIVENNSMLGTPYGVAFADCGGSPANRCQARDNVMKPKSGYPGVGVDLNRAHAALISGNRILGSGERCVPSMSVMCRCGTGLTVDDTRDATISENVVEGCTGPGIALGNGAVPANRPWYLTGNTVENNIVRNNGGVGLLSQRNEQDPQDHNALNVFRDNRLNGNARGGCWTNAEQNTFVANGPQACLPQSGIISSGPPP